MARKKVTAKPKMLKVIKIINGWENKVDNTRKNFPTIETLYKVLQMTRESFKFDKRLESHDVPEINHI